MILVRQDVSDLTKGYLLLQDLVRALDEVWAPRLHRLYVAQLAQYRQDLRIYEQLSRFGRLFRPEPERPQNPLRPPLLDRVYSPLWQRWLGALKSTVATQVAASQYPGENPDSGREGERRLLAFLSKLLDDRYFALYRLHMHSRDRADADVVVVGPKGLWLFDAKNWHGEVHGPARGPWTQVAPNGRVIDHPSSPLYQWYMVSNEIATVLRTCQWNDALRQLYVLRPKGGVVFTTGTEESTLHIRPAHKVEWGQLADCARWLEEAPDVLEGDYLTIFRTLDCLLMRHQQVWEVGQVCSMAAEARTLVKQTQSELEEIRS